MLRREPGPWLLKKAVSNASGFLWLLVLDGVLARDVVLEDVISTELL